MDNLKFKWKLKGTEFDETFIPYNKIELSNWFDINTNFDRYNQFDRDISVSEYKIKESISDYIMDASTIYSIQKYVLENKEISAKDQSVELVNDILNSNDLVQSWIEVLKIDLSILLNSSVNEIKSASSLLELIDLIESYKNSNVKSNNADTNGIYNDIISFDLDMFNNKIRELFQEAIEWINLLNTTSNISLRQKKKILRTIDNLITRIPNCIGEDSHFLYSRIKMLVSHAKIQKKSKSFGYVKMVISQSEFERLKGEIVSQAVEKMNYIQNLTMTYDQLNEMYDDLFLKDNKLIQLKKFFQNNSVFDAKGNEKVLDKVSDYYKNGRGCFGILETKNKNYFALSGNEDYKGVKNFSLTFNSDIYELSRKINSTLFNDKYIWATLSDNTLRYINADYNKSNRNFAILGSPIKLCEDNEVSSNLEIGFHYACCERKMQDYCNDWNIDKVYYSRWTPCEKCIPSFNYELGNVKVYALSRNYSTWNNKISKVEEYKLERTLSHGKLV